MKGYRPENFQKYSRNIRVNFWASEEEYAKIRKRMETSKATNLSAYLRNMATNGYCVSISDTELKEILSLFRRLSSNTNQIAKRLNESGRIYGVDVQEILSGQKEIENRLRQLVESINEIK